MKDVWKENAKSKQLEYKHRLGLTASGTWGKDKIEYPHILEDEDAKNGANFYCYKDQEEWKRLQDWAKRFNGKKVNFLGAGMKNMLRSEHIPYNLFYPLEKFRKDNPQMLKQFLEELFKKQNISIDKITQIKIEYVSGRSRKELLNDNTSFDAYIEYKKRNDTCGLGIEVKYTEKSYPYGATEKKRMFDDDSEYNLLSKKSGYYREEKLHKLRSKILKQPWRNHLLGLKLLALNEIQKFYSVHIYPEGNKYQAKVCDEYINCLSDKGKNTFVPVTFERFVEVADKVFTKPENKNWIDYLKRRY